MREMEGSIVAASNDIENPYIQLQTSLKEEFDRFSPMSTCRCIHRVPLRLRVVCEKAYTPHVVSIGPLHHGGETLKAMEEHKMRYLQYFLGRSNLGLMHYIEKIKDQEEKLRGCYSVTNNLTSDEFVKIIIVDAIFLIEFLFRNWYPALIEETDCLFGEPQMVDDVYLDLLLLENQLPFFILEDLFDPDIFPISSINPNVLDGVDRLSIMFLCHWFLARCGIHIEETVAELEKICCSNVKHLVDLLRRLYIAPILKAEATERPATFVTAPSIEELHQAGVKLKACSNNNLFDIRFKDGILIIPKLEIVDSSELILRNLVAYEQCLFQADNYISDYVAMMDQLVDTPKDVNLLVEHRIVKNRLGGGNNELSTIINSMATGVNIYRNMFNYGTLCQDLNEYCSSPWHRRIANLKQNYFNTPWATLSFIAAVFLLILTVIQTICSIISVL